MTTARELMTPDCQCVQTTQTLADAAKMMRDLGVGMLPICGEDQQLHGVVTDRDIVVQCIAEDGDPSAVIAKDIAGGKPVTIGADDSIEETLSTMVAHDVRRLPVIDGHEHVGMLSQADLARALPEQVSGALVEAISKAPANN